MNGRWAWIIVALAAIALVALTIRLHLYNSLERTLESALRWVEQLGFWGVVFFVLLYVLATILFVPGTILTVGAGTIFGFTKGALCVSIAATLGATAAFLIGRYFARDWVARKFQGNDKFKALDSAVGEEGWKIVALTRLSPIFPFVLVNYAFGLTQVRLRDYVIASWIGMMPGTLLYVYLGSLVKAGATGQGSGWQWLLRGVGFVATLLVILLLTKLARARVARSVSSPN